MPTSEDGIILYSGKVTKDSTPPNYLLCSISVRHSNKMTGTVLAAPSKDKDLSTSVNVVYTRDMPANIFVDSNFVRDNGKDIANQRKASIYIPYTSGFAATIRVRPHNKMTGIVEVIAPPIIQHIVSPVQDAFVREGIPRLNYGFEQDMFVGSNPNEVFRSAVQFPINLGPELEIKSAKLVLYPSSDDDNPMELGLFRSESEWIENSITWRNQPNSSELITAFTSTVNKQPVEIDLTSTVTEWYAGTKENYGLILKSLDEATPSYIRYNTRESAYAPQLIIEYTEKFVRSMGRVNIPTSITAQATTSKGLATSITVKSFTQGTGFPVGIKVIDPNALPVSISVARPILPATITVKQSKLTPPISAAITVRVSNGDERPATISVSRPFMPVSITVKEQTHFGASITVRESYKSSIEATISVTKPVLGASIHVPWHSSLPATITVKQHQDSDRPASITVSRPFMSAQITVKRSDVSDKLATITVKRSLGSDKPATITVRRTLNTGFIVRMQVRHVLSLPTSILVTQDKLYSFITVRRSDSSSKPASITVRRSDVKDFPSSITVRRTDFKNLPVSITAQARTADDLLVSITVNITFRPYSYIL